MHIDTYDFGKVVIDGKSYDSDVILLPDRVLDHWCRKVGHRLQVEDLDAVLERSAPLLVIGTGMHGMMKVPEETVAYLKGKGIESLALKTREACSAFNEHGKKGSVIGAFHLTC